MNFHFACLNCKKECITRDYRQKYCSRSYAGIVNNKLYPRKHTKPFKRPKTKFYLCACGASMDKYAKQCRKCYDKENRGRVGKMSIECAKTTKGPSIHAYTRTHAKNIMIYFEIPKICVVCGYSKYVEICHIRPISDFPGETPLSIVNALNNLVHLCPNHHKEFDRNLMTQEERVIVAKGSECLMTILSLQIGGRVTILAS